MLHIGLIWFYEYVSSSIPEQGSKMLFIFHFFLRSVEQKKTTKKPTSLQNDTVLYCALLTAWLIYFLPLSWLWGRDIFYSRGSHRCVHAISQLRTKPLRRFAWCFKCLLLGNSSWNMTKSKSLKGKQIVEVCVAKDNLVLLSLNNKTPWIRYHHHHL